MAAGIGTVEIKKQRGKMNVLGLGKTPRGQRYIKQAIIIEASQKDRERFDAEVTAAVEKLLG